MVCFRKFTEFPRRTMYDILHDAYSYDSGNKIIWDDRHRPEQVEIGRNGIREKFKRKGYGHMQLAEAIRRIKEYDGLQKIIVCTNSNLIAPKNYESVGIKLYNRKENNTESAYTGSYLYYSMNLQFAVRNIFFRLEFCSVYLDIQI